MSSSPEKKINEIRPQEGAEEQFLKCNADIAFYGGAAGGGKSYALLLEPLYDVNNPGFGGVIFRRTTKQVTNEGSLWDTANDLYVPLGAVANNQALSLKFPSGAKVAFAHMEHEKNRLDWQGSQVPFIGFDELTHFTWKQFSYLVSRNRSVSGAKSRIRATLNPDPDHWVRSFIDWYIGDDGFAIKERSGVIRWFIIDGDDVMWADSKEELVRRFPNSLPKSFTFISSSVFDNKILLETDPAYLSNLQALPRVERARLLDGNWDIRPVAGSYFRRSDVEVVDALPQTIKKVRAWDQAGSIAKTDSDDPDYTAGVHMVEGVDGFYYITDVERFRAEGSQVDKKIQNIASLDTKATRIRLAQDPGQAGKRQAKSQIKMLEGYAVRAKPVSGDKETRAKPLASQWEAGNVKILRGDWNDAFFKEMEAFPDGGHDDQVDAAADAYDELVSFAGKKKAPKRPSRTGGAVGGWASA